MLVCYAQAGVALARHVNETGSRDWPDISVIAAAERLFPTDRVSLAQAFGPQVFETYGNREVMLIAAECEAHQGLHLSMENLFGETVVRAIEKAADLRNHCGQLLRMRFRQLALIRRRLHLVERECGKRDPVTAERLPIQGELAPTRILDLLRELRDFTACSASSCSGD